MTALRNSTSPTAHLGRHLGLGVLTTLMLPSMATMSDSQLASRHATAHASLPSLAATAAPAPALHVTDTAHSVTVAVRPASPPDRPALASRRVILYGDSLAWEAQEAFRTSLVAAGIGRVQTRTFGGTAICDWLDQMRRDQADWHPDAVVVEFSGNALTPCMKGADGRPLSGPAYFEKYTEDAETVLRIFGTAGTLVFLAGAPISLHAWQTHDPDAGRLNELYAGLAASGPFVRFIDAGAAVTDGGRWTATLPCLAAEPCTGGVDAAGVEVNVVRAPDGSHFCPVAHAAVRGVTGTCPVWSSGAHRYGTALAGPIPTGWK